MAYSKARKFDPTSVKLAKLAKALSHPARISILEEIAKRNTCICGDMVQILPLAQSTVSQHLKELKDAGLIKGEISGPKTCYCLNHSSIKELNQLFGSLIETLNKNNLRNKELK